MSNLANTIITNHLSVENSGDIATGTNGSGSTGTLIKCPRIKIEAAEATQNESYRICIKNLKISGWDGTEYEGVSAAENTTSCYSLYTPDGNLYYYPELNGTEFEFSYQQYWDETSGSYQTCQYYETGSLALSPYYKVLKKQT